MSNTHPSLGPSYDGLDDQALWKGRPPRKLFDRLETEPVIAGGIRVLGDALRVAMSDRTLELVALRVSVLVGNSYIWTGHTYIALGSLLTFEEIAGVAVGAAAFTGRDASVLRAVEELVRGARLSHETRFALGSQALSVIVAAGFYRLVATIMQDVPPEPGVPVVPGLGNPAQAARTYHRRAA
jgi:alkylhydroperoxidase/carboxymuconolactone decarboxylase family protein YurZ